MRHYVLECFRDESTGELGLGLLDMPRDETTNAAHDGLTIAHDIVEHVNGPERIGTIEDELEALGAIWYVRGQHGELRRDGAGSFYSVEQNIAGDITRMYRDYIYGAVLGLAAPRTARVHGEDALQTILEHAANTYLSDFDRTEPEYRRAAREWPTFRRVALARMRRGYSKARRRYSKQSASHYHANNLFWAIADAVQPHAKHAQFPGQRFKLTVWFRAAEAICTEDYSEA